MMKKDASDVIIELFSSVHDHMIRACCSRNHFSKTITLKYEKRKASIKLDQLYYVFMSLLRCPIIVNFLLFMMIIVDFFVHAG